MREGSTEAVKEQLDQAIELKMPLLDSRVIGIANATADIEDALFRRFCHVIIEEIMYVTTPPSDLEGMRMCLNDVTRQSQTSSLAEDLEFKLLNEVNLQWQFSFLPTLLNKKDGGNNYIVKDLLNEINEAKFPTGTQNAIIAGKKSGEDQLYAKTKTSALYKIIRNNFGVDDDMDGGSSLQLQKGIYKCLASAVLGGSGTFSLETAGKETPSTSTTKLSSLKQMIQDALNDANGDGAEATNILLLTMKKESNSVSNNADAAAWIGKLLGLVEESKGTSIREEIVGNFYPSAIEFIARHKAPSDEKDQLIRFVNAFIVMDIDENEVSDETAQVDIKAIEKLGVMNAINALQQKQIKLVPTLRSFKEAGQIGAVNIIIDVYLKTAQGKNKEALEKYREVYGK